MIFLYLSCTPTGIPTGACRQDISKTLRLTLTKLWSAQARFSGQLPNCPRDGLIEKLKLWEQPQGSNLGPLACYASTLPLHHPHFLILENLVENQSSCH